MNQKRKKSLWLIPLVLIILLIAGGVFYICDNFDAAPSVAVLLTDPPEGISVIRKEGWIAFQPEKVRAGLIFYPGGKVEAAAYTPLLESLAAEGFLTVAVEMPLRIAFLNSNAADAVISAFPGVDTWIISGHSLGGVAASAYAAAHSDVIDGLVLLASYSVTDLQKSSIPVLVIYGSEDGILKINNFERNRNNLPDILTEVVIPGGNHSGFGAYGLQPGDGSGSVSAEEQVRIAVKAILSFCEDEILQ